MFKSWSVGKPQILVQASVEKKTKKKTKHNIIYQKNCNDINNNDQPTKTHYVYINAGIVNWNNNYKKPEK